MQYSYKVYLQQAKFLNIVTAEDILKKKNNVAMSSGFIRRQLTEQELNDMSHIILLELLNCKQPNELTDPGLSLIC